MKAVVDQHAVHVDDGRPPGSRLIQTKRSVMSALCIMGSEAALPPDFPTIGACSFFHVVLIDIWFYIYTHNSYS